MSGINPYELHDIAHQAFSEAVRSIEKHGDQAHLPDGTGPETFPLATKRHSFTLHFDRRAEQLAARATLDTKAHSQNEGGDGTITWWHILREEVFEAAAESDPEKLRAELIQIAAVAIKWAEAIDRRPLEEKLAILEERNDCTCPDPALWTLSLGANTSGINPDCSIHGGMVAL